MEEAARRIHLMGPRYVLVKGGHLKGDATDLLWNGPTSPVLHATDRLAEHSRHRLHLLAPSRPGFARGRPWATRSGRQGLLTRAIREGFQAGRGVGQLRHFIPDW